MYNDHFPLQCFIIVFFFSVFVMLAIIVRKKCNNMRNAADSAESNVAIYSLSDFANQTSSTCTVPIEHEHQL